MIDVITMSSKGQFVIPRSIREEMAIQKSDKFMIMNEKDSIILKRVDEEKERKEFIKLLDDVNKRFKNSGLTYKDIEKEIQIARRSKDSG